MRLIMNSTKDDHGLTNIIRFPVSFKVRQGDETIA